MAPHAIGKLYLARFLTELRRQYQKQSIDLSLNDYLTDSVISKINVGIRVGTVRDRRFIARTVPSVLLEVVATSVGIASEGAPSSLVELKAMPLSLLQDPITGRGGPWFSPAKRASCPTNLASPVMARRWTATSSTT